MVTIPTAAVSAFLRGEYVEWAAFGVSSAEFLDACAAEDLTALVHERLATWPDRGEWPQALRQDLAKRARAETVTELVRQRELIHVLDALAAAQVHPILLKGTALAYSVYTSPSLRARCDTDLLVRRRGLDVTRSIMIRLGYTTPPYCDGVFCQVPVAKNDEFCLEHVFDFHWKISTQPVFADRLTYDEIAAEAVGLPSLGLHARAAGPVHALLLACIHPVMHHRNIERMIWLYDIHLLVSRLSSSELERFVNLAVTRKLGAVCAHQLTAARARFSTRVSPDVLLTLANARDSASVAYLRSGRRWQHELVSSARGLPRWSERIRLACEVLFPAPKYMFASYRVTNRALGLTILPVLYAHRNARGILKVLTGRK